MNDQHLIAVGPWYRDRWPWLLMAGPFVVVVAGFITLSLALQSTDGLVVDDYYKRGKEVNMSLARDDLAAARGLRATLDVNQHDDTVRVQLFESAAGTRRVAPGTLSLRFVHATRSGLDRVVQLAPLSPALVETTGTAGPNGSDEPHSNGLRYGGTVGSLAPGRWNIVLEDSAQTWRLMQSIRVGQQSLGDIRLVPPPAVRPAAASER